MTLMMELSAGTRAAREPWTPSVTRWEPAVKGSVGMFAILWKHSSMLRQFVFRDSTALATIRPHWEEGIVNVGWRTDSGGIGSPRAAARHSGQGNYSGAGGRYRHSGHFLR